MVMLGFPLMWAMPDDVRQNDLEWYETVTYPEGPAMTWGVFSTGWLDLGQFTKADELFTKAYSSYAREPFKVRCALPTTHPLTHNYIYIHTTVNHSYTPPSTLLTNYIHVFIQINPSTSFHPSVNVSFHICISIIPSIYSFVSTSVHSFHLSFPPLIHPLKHIIQYPFNY